MSTEQASLPPLSHPEAERLKCLRASLAKKGATPDSIDQIVGRFFCECLEPALAWCTGMGGMKFDVHTRATAKERDDLAMVLKSLEAIQKRQDSLMVVPFRIVRGESRLDRQARQNAEREGIEELRSLLNRFLPSIASAARIAGEEVKEGGTGKLVVTREALMIQRAVKWLTANGVDYAASAGSPMIEAVKLAWEYWGLNDDLADECDAENAVIDRVRRLPEKDRRGDFQTAFQLHITE